MLSAGRWRKMRCSGSSWKTHVGARLMRVPEAAAWLAVLCCVASASAQSQQPDAAAVNGAAVTSAPAAAAAGAAHRSPGPHAGSTMEGSSSAAESLLIGPGDLLHITVLREGELEQRVRVLDSGEITLALAGNVAVEGLTPAQAAVEIAGRYREGKFLVHPEVSVFVEEYATQTVTILGEVAHPGTVRVTAPRTLI